MFIPRQVIAIGFALLFTACAGDLSFTVRRAPKSNLQHATVSVFGVCRGGRMASDAWDEIRPQFEKALATTSCEGGYDERNRESFAAWFTAIDDEIRENGVAEEFLAKISSAAKGQNILLVTQTAGAPRVPGRGGAPDEPKGKGRTTAQPRSGRDSFQGRSPSLPTSVADAFEMSAIVYSTERHEVIREIEMKYTGDNQGEAVQHFINRVRAEMAGTECAGWTRGKPLTQSPTPTPGE